MANDNSDILALLGDILRATDRQTEENKRAIQELRDEWSGIFGRFATTVADGFNRVEQKIDGVKQEVSELREGLQQTNQRLDATNQRLDATNQRLDTLVQHTGHLTEKVDSIDRRLGRIETDLPNYLDVVRRLTVLETIVLPKAS